MKPVYFLSCALLFLFACGNADRSDVVSDTILKDETTVLPDADIADPVDDTIMTDTDAPFTCNIHQESNTIGIRTCVTGTQEGYTLFAPLLSKTVYLIDNLGRKVHEWQTDFLPGYDVHLLENGELLVALIDDRSSSSFGPMAAGLIRKLAWDGSVNWEFSYGNAEHVQHHDIHPMPNGNILLVAWERKTEAEAVAAGRDPASVAGKELMPDHIVEVKPEQNGGTIVWEWHVWDHLVQNIDPAKPNYGEPAEHPELINLNHISFPGPDWTHINSVAYNPSFDQIVVSVLYFDEIWIIDHSTTTAEAAGHSGGRYGKGGDILYRWGNPAAYGCGTIADQTLFHQHDASWIPAGHPGAGHLLIFNNQQKLPDGTGYSTVDEIVTPTQTDGSYGTPTCPGQASELFWRYSGTPPETFLGNNLSGAQRLPNGNTLASLGPSAQFTEVTPAGDIVWDYISPVGKDGIQHDINAIANGNIVFRAHRYLPDYPGLTGKDLTPQGTIE